MLSGTSPWNLLGRTEWCQRTASPAFCAVVSLDLASLRGGVGSTLELQLRHVEEPFWDARDADEAAALRAMPLLGRASFSLAAPLASSWRVSLASSWRVKVDATTGRRESVGRRGRAAAWRRLRAQFQRKAARPSHRRLPCGHGHAPP